MTLNQRYGALWTMLLKLQKEYDDCKAQDATGILDFNLPTLPKLMKFMRPKKKRDTRKPKRGNK